MAVSPELQALLGRLDTDTTAVATAVRSLLDLISTAMTQADVDTVKASLTGIATRLEQTASDASNPVPPGPPPAPVTKPSKTTTTTKSP